MRTRTGLLFSSLTLLLVSCAPAPTPDTRAADSAAIQSLDEQWSAIAGKRDPEGVVAFYAPDAVLLPPNEPIAKDPQAIRKSWGNLLGPDTSVSWKPSHVEVARSGDIGYLYGTYQLTMKGPKASINDTGKLVEIWNKQPDGKWKCAVDIFNSDLPLPSPEPKK